jgi:cell wall-associated NlpC family hydrolase
MQFPNKILGLFSAILLSGGVFVDVQAEPKPKARSFRPIVPIKQNVRGGMDQMKSQTVSVKIPPPPIPEHPPVVDLSSPGPVPSVPGPALTDGGGPSPEFVGPPAELIGGSLPPEAVKEASPLVLEEKKELTVEADSPPEPAPAAEDKEKNKPVDGPTLERLHAEAHALAEKKLTYIFGAEDPDSGGLDCSATIQYLLNKIGVKDVPRTSYDQYAWLKKNKMLDDVYGKSAHDKLFKKLSPGDLIFWGGTYNSGHRVSHVMLYMGYDKTRDKHYIFGARGKSVKGLTGSGVDIFELSQQKGRLIAHGKIPGLIY